MLLCCTTRDRVVSIKSIFRENGTARLALFFPMTGFTAWGGGGGGVSIGARREPRVGNREGPEFVSFGP